MPNFDADHLQYKSLYAGYLVGSGTTPAVDCRDNYGSINFYLATGNVGSGNSLAVNLLGSVDSTGTNFANLRAFTAVGSNAQTQSMVYPGSSSRYYKASYVVTGGGSYPGSLSASYYQNQT